VNGSLVAIGDLFVDMIVDLRAASPPVSFAALSSGSNTFARIDRVAGGSALHAAAAAAGSGFASGAVIGAIGAVLTGEPDLDGQFLAQEAMALDIRLLVALSRTSPTGRVIAVYSASGERLMVSDRGANGELGPGDLTAEMFQAARRAAAVHISGYTLLQAARREAVRALASAAKQAGALVALDYAPHDLHRHLATSDLVDWAIPFVDCAFVELPLASRLAGDRASDTGEVDVASVLTWWGRRFEHAVLHLGPERAVVRSAGRDRTVRTTYLPGAPSRGQSARVQVRILADLVSGVRRGPLANADAAHSRTP